MEIVNLLRSYPAWAQVLFVICLVIQLCLAFFVPRASTAKLEPIGAPTAVSTTQQSATGNGNVQIGQASIVNIADRTQFSNRLHAEKLASFLVEAQKIRARLDKNPLPIKEHNDWVEHVNDYLATNLGSAYKVRFSDFSGITLYGNGSDRSKISNSLEARSKRLHEFSSELAR